MTDLLVQRLKSAKRELTALKTAHKRGLGMLKVYKVVHYFEDDGINPGNEYEGVLTINFSASSAPSPFFVVFPISTQFSQYNVDSKTIDVTSIKYYNSGLSAEVGGQIFYGYGDVYNKVIIYSVAPVTSTSGNWSLI